MFLNATERLRLRLQALIRHGDAAQIVRTSARRRKGKGLRAQNLSYFLNGHRKRPLSFEDVEDIAFHYNLSMGDLLEPTRKKSELPAAEQRLLIAYRAAAVEFQTAALMMLEASAVQREGAPRKRFTGSAALSSPPERIALSS